MVTDKSLQELASREYTLVVVVLVLCLCVLCMCLIDHEDAAAAFFFFAGLAAALRAPLAILVSSL